MDLRLKCLRNRSHLSMKLLILFMPVLLDIIILALICPVICDIYELFKRNKYHFAFNFNSRTVRIPSLKIFV